MRYIWILLFSIYLSFTFLGCKRANTKIQETDSEDVTNNLALQKEDILNEVFSRFPSPEEMLSIINKNTTSFDKKILNKTDKVNEYLDSRSQALNLGVYAADLGYVSLLDQHKDSYKFFEAIYKLADNLSIASAFDAALMKRTQNNISNPDSLRKLTDLAFNKITDYLIANNKEKTFAIISIGGFTEAMYLSFQVAGKYSPTNPIVQRIADQKLVLENLIDYCSIYSEDETVNSSIELFKPIQSIYSKVTDKKSTTTVTHAADGKLIIKGGNKLSISEDQYNQLKVAVTSMRNTITQN